MIPFLCGCFFARLTKNNSCQLTKYLNLVSNSNTSARDAQVHSVSYFLWKFLSFKLQSYLLSILSSVIFFFIRHNSMACGYRL